MTNSSEGLPRIFIFGSCVSRDTFEFLIEDAQLNRYVARQSSISAFAGDPGLTDQLRHFDSPFQERVVKHDLRSSLTAELNSASNDVDLVVIDLVDERGGVMQFENGIATRLAEFWSHGGREASKNAKHISFGSDEHFSMWKESVSMLRQLLIELGLFDKTVVLNTPWASTNDRGETLEIPSWMIEPKTANQLYVRYFDTLEAFGFRTITLPDELAVSPIDHKWGTSPFHYVESAYLFLANSIRAELSLPAKQSVHLERRDTNRWGSFVDLLTPQEIRRSFFKSQNITVWNSGWPIDLRVEDKGSETTIVSLHAALGENSEVELPVFTGQSITQDLDANRIFLSDSTLYSSADLRLGWFLGSSGLNLTDTLVDIIATVQHELNAKHLVFFGMSGGGFASLNLSRYFPGSLALPVNPQTNVLDYAKPHWMAFARSAFDCFSEDDARRTLESHPHANQRDAYRVGYDNSVIYLQNRKDGHVSTQMIPFFEALEWPKEMAILFGDWGNGHQPPPAPVLAELLSAVPKASGAWNKLAHQWNARLGATREWVRQETGR